MYLGALGFTKPLERLVLHAVPLKSLLEWLSKPRGPNLVEATTGAVPEKALVLAATRHILYGEDPPSVGVGLMYKPHYISTESFCIAYMHLNVWHAVASSENSTDKLDSSHFILVSISEMSDLVPVAIPHPIFLYVGSKEVMEQTGEPLAPLWFWGFRLHTVWSWLPGGEPVRQIAFPGLWGDATTPMLEYEPEKFSQSMRQGPKMVIILRPPSKEHWNIDSDLILTLMMDTYQQRLEAKRAGHDPEWESAGAEASPRGTPVPEEAPLAIAGGSKAASPTETTHQGESDLETALGVVEHIHALRLQIIHDMGSMREVEQAAVCTLMTEFARLQSILCEDLTKSLSALHSELETSSEVLSTDILNILKLHPGDPGFFRARELIRKHHQSVLMKINLPLIELEAAKEDLKRFLQECLCELGSNPKAREVLEEISQILLSYGRKVRETILVRGMEQLGVFNRIMLALSVDQPMEAVLLPGILDGLSGRLGLTPPGVVDQPTSAREGISRRWAATLREAVMMTEGREANQDQVTSHVVHPGLHQDYELDFQMWRVDDIAPTLTSPMLAGIASSVRLTGRPAVPKGPVSPKTRGPVGLWRSSCSTSSTRPLTRRWAHGDRGRETIGAGGNRSRHHHPGLYL